jgi:hypothetical protein
MNEPRVERSEARSAYLPGRPLRTGREAATLFWVLYAIAVYVVWTLPWPSALFFVALVPIAVRAYRRTTVARFSRSNRVLLDTMHTNPEQAARELAVLADEFWWPRYLRRLAGYNRGLALLRSGRLDDATATLAEVDRSGGVVGLDAAIAGTLAYVHALRGEVELASNWLGEAKRRHSPATARFPHVLAQITIDLRAGKAREVATWLEDQWPQLEHAMTGERLRPLRALRAFAVAQAGGAREGGTAELVLAALRPARYQELAYLGTAWPELDQFLRGSLGQ